MLFSEGSCSEVRELYHKWTSRANLRGSSSDCPSCSPGVAARHWLLRGDFGRRDLPSPSDIMLSLLRPFSNAMP